MTKLLTLAEAARILDRDHSALRKQARLGRLRATRVGRLWVVTEAAIEKYRAEHLREREGPTDD